MAMFVSIIFLVFQTLLNPSPISAESYLTARLNPTPFQNFAIQEVHLYPGWQFELKEMTIQTMVPKVGSNFSRCQVRVFPGRQPVEGPEDMHAHVYFPTAVEEVTMYIERDAPEVTELPTTSEARVTEAPTTPEVSIEHGYVLAQLQAERWHTFKNLEIVRLSPAWHSKFRDPMTVLLQSEIPGLIPARNVTIIPVWKDVTKEDGGIRAMAKVRSERFPEVVTNTLITIYPIASSASTDSCIIPDTSSDTTSERPRTTVPPKQSGFLEARIFPKPWHSFKEDQSVWLHPGWDGHLKFNTTQTLVPVQFPGQHKTVLKGHVVTVVPGYQTIVEGDNAAEARVTLHNWESLSDPYDRVTIYYP